MGVLFSNEIHAIPVVDDTGRFVATFSAMEATAIFDDEWPNLEAPVLKFLSTHCPDENALEKQVRKSTPLWDAIDRIHQFNIHRVWILDDDDKVVGVVATSDILSLLRAHFYDHKVEDGAPIDCAVM